MSVQPASPAESRHSAWIVARLDVKRDGLVLELTDNRGARPQGAALFPVVWPLSPTFSWRVLVPADWLEFVTETLRRHRESLFAQHLEAPVIPVFLRPPSGTEALDWEYGLALLTNGAAQPVRLAPSAKVRRSPFNLPINVLAVDDTAQEMSAVEDSSWYSQRPDVRVHGLVVTSTTIDELRPELSGRTHDAVVARDAHWQRALAAMNAVPLNDDPGFGVPVTRPRLVILLVGTDEPHVLPRRFSVPQGVALLVVNHLPNASVAGFMREFFYGIFHDQPLHGALHEANTSPQGSAVPRAWLFANPDTDQNIRISDALRQVEALRDRIRYDVTVGNVDAFIARAGQFTPQWDRIARALRGAMPASASVRQAADLSDRLKIDFSRETRGLVPIAETLGHLRHAEFELGDLRKELSEIVSQPEMANAIAEVQQRHVDIAMESYDAAIATYVRIEKQLPLSPQAQYRVRVHIGHRAEDSLVVGEPPSLDPLLPELEPGQSGHDLDVATFENDFELLSPRLLRLHLPALGGSMPIYFVVRTLGEHDAAQLRVNVYHENHLLQAFLLTAEVNREGSWRDTPAVSVELDVSTTEAFGNLRELGPRALAIGVNLDDDGATHRVMIKKDGHAGHPLKIADDVVQAQLERFRSLLKNYTSDSENRPLFPTYPEEGARPVPEFDEAVRALGRLGQELYLGIFQEIEDEIHDDLVQLRGAEDLTIQVARHRGNAVLPWPVLYDYVGPSPAFKDNAPVCRGAPLPNAPQSVRDGLEQWRGCPHNPGREVYCVQGFWGFRHRIEQITSGGGASDSASKVELGAAAHAVCLASSITQAASSNLSNALQTAFGSRFVPFPPPSNPSVAFGTFMWTAASRPGVLVLLSHLSNPGSGATEILLVPPSAGAPVTLTADQVSQFTRLMRVWKDQPRSLVLLMACESGASTVATLNDFVMAFKAAGAAAIVGTEVPVYVSLAARFAQELIKTLQARQASGEPTTLGKAVRSVANQLLGEGNPLGLIFNYCGNADLVLA